MNFEDIIPTLILMLSSYRFGRDDNENGRYIGIIFIIMCIVILGFINIIEK